MTKTTTFTERERLLLRDAVNTLRHSYTVYEFEGTPEEAEVNAVLNELDVLDTKLGR